MCYRGRFSGLPPTSLFKIPLIQGCPTKGILRDGQSIKTERIDACLQDMLMLKQ